MEDKHLGIGLNNSDSLSNEGNDPLNLNLDRAYGLDGVSSSSQGAAIVFIDPRVEDYQTLWAGLDPAVKAIVLDPTRDGAVQIGEVLAQQQNLSSVHIFSHGEVGRLQLGSIELNSGNLGAYRDTLQQWGNALTNDGDILLYGCKLAQGEEGGDFVGELSRLTGADIAASDDLTGAVSLGGDWHLEVSEGKVQAVIPFSEEVLEDYDRTLAVNVSLLGNTVSFTGDGSNDSLYLRVNPSNDLEFSNDGVNFSSDLSAAGGVQALNISQNTLIDIALGDGADSLFIDRSLNTSLTGAKGRLDYSGGTGEDSIYGANVDNTWVLTDPNAGRGVLNAVFNFTAVEKVIGGSGVDKVITDAITTAWNQVSGGLVDAYRIVSQEASNGVGIIVDEIESSIGVTTDVINNIEQFLEELKNELGNVGSDLDSFINDGIAKLEGLLGGAVDAFLNGSNYAQVLFTNTLETANVFFDNIINKVNDDFLFSSINSKNVTIYSNPALGDDLILERLSAGVLRLRAVSGSDIIDFKDPTESLTINMGSGDDRLTVSAIDLDASLIVNGGFGTDAGEPFVDYLDGNDTVNFQGNLNLFGKDLKVVVENISVASGIRIATQGAGEDSGDIEFTGTVVDILSGASIVTKAATVGKESGLISIAAKVKDFSGIFPIDVFPSEDVSVSIASGVLIEGGEVIIEASKTSQTSILPVLLVALQSKEAKINIQGASIKGTSVKINSNAADTNILEDEATLVNNLAIQPAISLLNLAAVVFPVLASFPLLSAVSVSMRKSDSLVSLTDTSIISSGDVNIGAENTVKSTAQAAGGADPGKSGSYKASAYAPFSVGYSKAEGSAQTSIIGVTSIVAAGNVNINATAETDAKVNASTAVNAAPKSTSRGPRAITNPLLSLGVSVAVTESNTISKSIVGEDVSIVADGNVTVDATGDIKVKPQSGASVFIDGSGGVGVSVASDKVDIQTLVDGQITAKSLIKQELGLNLAGIDANKDTINLPNHGLQTGDELNLYPCRSQ
jgi:hypothetical protein